MRKHFWTILAVGLLATAGYAAWKLLWAVAVMFLLWALESWYCGHLEKTLVFVDTEIKRRLQENRTLLDEIQKRQGRVEADLVKRELRVQLHSACHGPRGMN